MCGFEGFSEELKPIVTTLEQHADCLPTQETLAAQILNSLCTVCDTLETAAFMEEYRNRSFVIGKAVHVIQNGETRNARVTDVLSDGGLCVIYENGETAVLHSAEISIRTL